ncbi:MAG: DUF1800 domain-containing protein [Planctomycetota bacterium]|nr:DUF1800 domain-containing protein [Planctomycetota bacterium]
MDAEKAWQQWEPTNKRPWSIRLAAHLYRRAGFGGSYEELLGSRKVGMLSTVDQLFEAEAAPFQSQMDNLKKQVRSGGSVEQLPNYWLYRMVKSDKQLLEKSTLFWHGHFATSATKVDHAGLMLEQNDLLRDHALGKFLPLVQGISRDPAMLTYLDSRVSRKTRPNENYARELMELFCLGPGNYSEQDIKELARAFTGWEIRHDRFRFNRHQHDSGQKNILGAVGAFNGDQAVEIVLQQPAASLFIARKLLHFFVTDLPLEREIVEPLATTLRRSDFDLSLAIRKILTSRLFYESIGQKVRSPVELAIGFLRSLEATGNFVKLARLLRESGQLPFFPPNVKGWPGGRSWINSATLLGRINLISELLTDEKTRLKSGDLASWLGKYEIPGSDAVEFFESLLLARPLPAEARDRIGALIGGNGGSRNDRLKKSLVAIASLPEFQLG